MSYIAYLTHGGGPLPLLNDPGHRELVASLRELAAVAPTPKAILLVSAHWEASPVSLTGHPSPSLIHDYYGFPEAAYSLRYPVPGQPALAERARALLEDAGVPASVDQERGLDHGVFVPLSLMYPAADVPVVEMSVHSSLEPALHRRLGAALAPLLNDGVALIGSGSSFHNMAVLMGRDRSLAALEANRAFEDWLRDTLAEPGLSTLERGRRLDQWRAAPGGAFAHPREEHLMPALVCAGAAGDRPGRVFAGRMGAANVSSVLWV
ncbi:DODA-type extradiol aromatic ring-opening family dioxygenase [Alloalcanivorax marinus]|uniref:DODA-type extradiol aromatic ring-opening family dioxygenase n=1 Tax=Alloalcanivorax marinus TaxID=1177169 RepID=UPI0019330443|nr:class III extradiol ring-cleavage dioxygenase [Alloalcanivorax marinus]MBL7250801.1 dioxygenase [Alloalcanivorax marinus]